METKNFHKTVDYIKGKDITFYILYPGSTNDELSYDTHQLGILSTPLMNKTKFTQHRITIFRRSQGFYILQEIINRNRVDILEKIEIKSSSGKAYSIEKFLATIGQVDTLL